MAAPAVIDSEPTAPASAVAAPRGLVDRLRAVVAALGAAVLGAAPHVLHHVGPLAGAALLAGATGKLLFGALGFVLTIPMLRRLRGRTGSWRVPGGALAVMAVIFTFSSFVIGPALAGGGEAERDSAAPSRTVPAAPPGVSESAHESHHP